MHARRWRHKAWCTTHPLVSPLWLHRHLWHLFDAMRLRYLLWAAGKHGVGPQRLTSMDRPLLGQQPLGGGTMPLTVSVLFQRIAHLDGATPQKLSVHHLESSVRGVKVRKMDESKAP